MGLILFRANKCLNEGTHHFPPGLMQKLNWSPCLQPHNFLVTLYPADKMLFFKTEGVSHNSPHQNSSFPRLNFLSVFPPLLAWPPTSLT